MQLPATERTTLRRKRERGSRDRELIDRVLDEGLVCHVGFVADHGPVVLPMAYARRGDTVYLHGAAANDMLRHLADGTPACLTVTILDGLVLARSAFHHSANYRSVVLFGVPTVVTDREEKEAAMDALLDHMAAGRSCDARRPTESELRKTLVVRLPISEGSVKVRSGGPIDDDEDMAMPIWAGVIPLRTVPGDPVADSDGVAAPGYVVRHRLSS